MRFDDLFADLADEASASGARELWDEAQELANAEVAGRTLAQALPLGRDVRLELLGGARLRGVLLRTGEEWWAVRSGGELWLLRTEALLRAALVPATSAAPAASAGGKESEADVGGDVPLRRMLRSLARSRTFLRVEGVDGERTVGCLRMVGADFIEVGTEAGVVAVAVRAVAAVVTPE